MFPMRGGSLLTLAILLCLTLAGCVGGSASKTADGTDGVPPATAAPPEFDDATGAITGLVTDDEFQPIVGATVGVREVAGKITLSDAQGAYTLSNLAPGKYSLDANALGFESQARSIEVQVGLVSNANFALPRLPSLEPTFRTYPFTGFIDCATAIIRTTHYPLVNCVHTAANTENFQKIDKFSAEGWPDTWVGTLVEAQWNSQTNPDWLAFDYVDRNINYYGVYYRFRGTSPVSFLVERCGDYRANAFARAPAPCADDQVTASRMQLETFYVGKFQQETHTLDPVCRENITYPHNGQNFLPGYQQGCYGVGLGLELRWNNWVTVFHRALPDNMATFTRRPDG